MVKGQTGFADQLGSWVNWPSAASKLDFRVDGSELGSGIIDLHLLEKGYANALSTKHYYGSDRQYNWRAV